jgi:TetR/AcrR family transcriptional repressor of nem operon
MIVPKHKIFMRKKNFDPDKARLKAMHLFWHRGYETCSMDDLLNETGLSRSSFYNTFGNKRDLYVSVLDYFGQLSLVAYRCLHTNKPVIDALHDLFQMIFFSPAVKLEHGCLLVNTILEQQGNDEALVKIASDMLFKVEQELALFFERSKTAGQLNSSLSPQQLADYFMTVIKGLRVTAREGKSSTEIQESIKTAMLILEH